MMICSENKTWTRAVTRQHSSPEPVAHHEHIVLNSKSIRKVMLLPYNTLKQSEFNLPFKHITKSMTLTSVIRVELGWYCIKFICHLWQYGNLSIIREKLSLKALTKNIPNFSIKCLSLWLWPVGHARREIMLSKILDHHLSSYIL